MLYPNDPNRDSADTAEVAPLPTYTQLRAYVHAVYPSGDRARILLTALNSFRTFCGQNEADVMCHHWRVLPDDVMSQFETLLATQVAASTATKRAEHVRQLRRLMLTLHESSTLPAAFGDAMRAVLEARCLTVGAAARGGGINPSVMRRWMTGAAPTSKMSTRIPALEQFLSLPAGTLLTRLPRRSRARTAVVKRRRTEFGERMAALHAKRREPGWEPLWLPYEKVKPQWERYLVWKCDRNRPEIDIPVEKYFSPYWRVKPADEVGCKIRPWMQLPDGRIATSAGVSYGHFSTFWGWLRTTQGVPSDECARLTWCLDISRVRAHANWKEVRSGKRTSGIRDFVVQVAALTRPGAGYLWCTPELLFEHPNAVLLAGYDPGAVSEQEHVKLWHALCERVHAEANALKRNQYRPKALRKARDTNWDIKPLADLEDPVSTLIKGLNEIRAEARSLVPGRTQWTLLRDVLLSQMMISNPLRPGQFAAMTVRSDNTGNLYQTPKGAWRLQFDAGAFKNERGAACLDYDVGVPRSLWPHISHYLRAVRPFLAGADSDFMFLPNDLSQQSAMRDLKGGMWTGDDISDRVGILGLQLVPEMRSFCAYTLRHLVATAFLKRHPNQFTQLAKLLNDQLETVLRVYARETHDDAFTVQNLDIDNAMGASDAQ